VWVASKAAEESLRCGAPTPRLRGEAAQEQKKRMRKACYVSGGYAEGSATLGLRWEPGHLEYDPRDGASHEISSSPPRVARGARLYAHWANVIKCEGSASCSSTPSSRRDEMQPYERAERWRAGPATAGSEYGQEPWYQRGYESGLVFRHKQQSDLAQRALSQAAATPTRQLRSTRNKPDTNMRVKNDVAAATIQTQSQGPESCSLA
jgi:hypothetical protein